MAADPVAEAFSGFPWATMTRTGVDPMKPTEPCCDEPTFVCVSCGDDHECEIATLRADLALADTTAANLHDEIRKRDATIATLRAALDGLVEAGEAYFEAEVAAPGWEERYDDLRAALATAKEMP